MVDLEFKKSGEVNGIAALVSFNLFSSFRFVFSICFNLNELELTICLNFKLTCLVVAH